MNASVVTSFVILVAGLAIFPLVISSYHLAVWFAVNI